MPTPLTIRLFDTPDILLPTGPLSKLRSRQGQWLLARLVLLRGQAISRETAAKELWPHADAYAAGVSLRQSLADLRKALGADAERIRDGQARSLRFVTDGAEIDVLTFDALITEGSVEALQKAVALYRGPLLKGCEAKWATVQRQTYTDRCRRALETLADHARNDGDFAAAIPFLQRALTLDPFRQANVRALMQAHDRLGNLDAALQVYYELRHRLRIPGRHAPEPEPETAHLFLQIRAKTEPQTRPVAVQEVPPPTEHNALPTALTPLLGREKERLAVAQRLLTARLVTLTGIGGMGKTRLALEIARDSAEDYRHGVRFVALDALRESSDLWNHLATALELPRSPGQESRESVLDYLCPRHLLLIIDNCEHLREACAELVRHLLAECSSLRLLATSRQRLDLSGEAVYPLPPLSLPAERFLDSAEVAQNAAVQLFLARAIAGQPDFALTPENAPAIAAICRTLDGVPLALELAAALTPFLSPAEIAERLRDRFHLLQSQDTTLPKRQRSLRAMMDWSYELLTPPEKRLLHQLSVFAGGATLDAVENVCTEPDMEILPLLSRLIGKSLVQAETQSSPTRYRLLETVRQYGAERLREAGEETAIKARHRQVYTRLAISAETALTGPEQTAWLRRLDADYPNLRAALEGEPTDAADARTRLPIAGALGRYWQIRGLFAEGYTTLLRLLIHPAAQEPDALRANALVWTALLGIYRGNHEKAEICVREGQALFATLQNKSGLAGAWGVRGLLAKERGEPDAETYFTESLRLAQEAGDKTTEASGWGYRGILAADRGDFAAARQFYEKALHLREALQDSWGIAASWNNLGVLGRQRGDYASARFALEKSLALRRELADPRSLAISLNNLGLVAVAQEDFSAARAFLNEGLALCRRLGDLRNLAYALEAFARLAAAEQQPEQAARLFFAASALRERLHAPLPPSEQTVLTTGLQPALDSLPLEHRQLLALEAASLTPEQILALIN